MTRMIAEDFAAYPAIYAALTDDDRPDATPEEAREITWRTNTDLTSSRERWAVPANVVKRAYTPKP